MFRSTLRRHTMLHEDMRLFYDGFPRDAHPMAILSARWSARFRRSIRIRSSRPIREQVEVSVHRLLAKLPTIAAYAYKKSIGQPFVYPQNDLTYCENFLRMMFAVPSEPYEADPGFRRRAESAADRACRSRAELQHVAPCGWSARRTRTCSPRFRPASAPCGARCTAGRTRPASPCCERIVADGGNVKKYVDMAKDKDSHFRLMGFGHRVYKNFDPRATIIKTACDKLLAKLTYQRPDLRRRPGTGRSRPATIEYFIERKLYPNVDFYSGVIYRALGIPVHVHRALRHGPPRLDRPLGGNAPEPAKAHLPPAAGLCRPDATDAGAARGAEVGGDLPPGKSPSRFFIAL